MSETIFDKIVSGEIPSWKVWENKDYLAFLTPFANTLGVTVVIPKNNPGDYVFDVSPEAYMGIMLAAKEVAKLLKGALGVARVAMVFEGTGVAHLHAKLYPLHGEIANKTNVWPHHQEFYPEYIGYLTTVEGPKMDPNDLDTLQRQILAYSETPNE